MRGDEIPDQVGTDQQGQEQVEQVQQQALPRIGREDSGGDLDAELAGAPFDQVDQGGLRAGPAAPGPAEGEGDQQEEQEQGKPQQQEEREGFDREDPPAGLQGQGREIEAQQADAVDPDKRDADDQQRGQPLDRWYARGLEAGAFQSAEC